MRPGKLSRFWACSKARTSKGNTDMYPGMLRLVYSEERKKRGEKNWLLVA
jgi:hypothetical protein